MAQFQYILCLIVCTVAHAQTRYEECKSRDGGQWVKKSDCLNGCCVQYSDQGWVCGSKDDCSHSGGTWWLLMLMSFALGLAIIFGCMLLLACFGVPIPCCNRVINPLMQRWANRTWLQSRHGDKAPKNTARQVRIDNVLAHCNEPDPEDNSKWEQMDLNAGEPVGLDPKSDDTGGKGYALL